MIGKFWKIFAIIYIGILFRALIIRSLCPIPYEKEFLWWVTIFIGIGNAILIWLIGRKFFNEKIALLSLILYAISPWFAYLEVAGSVYIFIMFCLLVSFYGIFQIKKSPKFLILIVTTVVAVLLYGDFLKGITIFSDIGLINAVNQFQGETRKANLADIGRVIENRYIYFGQYLIFNFLKHFSPATYFTSEYKLLNFSFSPPILVGFLIPFFLGLAGWSKLWRRYGLITLVPLLLIIPSVFSKQSPFLSKLVIFAPVIIFTISYGFITYLTRPRNRLFLSLLIIALILLVIQMMVVIMDILLREPVRFHGLI